MFPLSQEGLSEDSLNKITENLKDTDMTMSAANEGLGMDDEYWDDLEGAADETEDEDEDEDADEDAAELYELELAWEYDLPILTDQTLSSETSTDHAPETASLDVPSVIQSQHTVNSAQSVDHILVDRFPDPAAGAPVFDEHWNTFYADYQNHLGNRVNPYVPFQSKLDWEFARWAKLHGPSSTAISELLKLDGVSTLLMTIKLK
jgi:hypothetical protein